MGPTARTLKARLVQPRLVRCARCGAGFALLARVDVAVTSVGIIVPFEGEAHQQQRLAAACDARIRALPNESVGVARCPQCHAWQPWMTALERPQAFVAGLLAGLVAGIVPMAFALVRIPASSPWHPDAAYLALFASAALIAAVATAFPLALSGLGRSGDPRAMTLDDFRRFAADAERRGSSAGAVWADRLGWKVQWVLPTADFRHAFAPPDGIS